MMLKFLLDMVDMIRTVRGDPGEPSRLLISCIQVCRLLQKKLIATVIWPFLI